MSDVPGGPAGRRAPRTLARMRRRRSYGAAGGSVADDSGRPSLLWRRAFSFASARRTRARRRRFDDVASLTVGVSEALTLLDPATLLPTSAEAAFERLRGDDRFARRDDGTQVRVLTRPAATAGEATRELAGARRTAVERFGGSYRIVASGVQPTAGRPSAHVSAGLHVHVAVAGADRALEVFNAARSYLPQIAALAANSPFLAGRDTGLASTRLKLAERYPHSGIPPAFSSWELLEEFVERTGRPGLAPDPRRLWWDMRLSARHGTIEFRVPDAQTHVLDVGAIAAVCQALVAVLLRAHDAGEGFDVHESHAIAANRWRALRDGVDGELVDLTTQARVGTRIDLAALLAMLEPFGAGLGCDRELAQACRLAADNGACRQRAVAVASGASGLTAWLVEQTEAL